MRSAARGRGPEGRTDAAPPLPRRVPHDRGAPGAKSFVDDLILGQGFVRSRAAPSLRSIENQPSTQAFVALDPSKKRPTGPALRRAGAAALLPPSSSEASLSAGRGRQGAPVAGALGAAPSLARSAVALSSARVPGPIRGVRGPGHTPSEKGAACRQRRARGSARAFEKKREREAPAGRRGLDSPPRGSQARHAEFGGLAAQPRAGGGGGFPFTARTRGERGGSVRCRLPVGR